MLAITELVGLGDTATDYNFLSSVDKSTTGTLANASRTSYTVVNKLLPAAFTRFGNFTRLKLYGPASISAAAIAINSIYIGNAATSGNAYNFDGNQVQVKINGDTSVSVPSGGVPITTDPVNFVIDGTKSVLIAMTFGTAAAVPYRSSLGTNFVAYYKSATSEAGTTLKSASYTAQSAIMYSSFIIEVSN